MLIATKFYYCSFHETGVYDLPRVIDYILFTTGQDDLYYIGFSLGTTSFLVMGTELPSYNSKIRLAVLMAPVSYVSHIAQPFYHKLARRRKILQVQQVDKAVCFTNFLFVGCRIDSGSTRDTSKIGDTYKVCTNLRRRVFISKFLYEYCVVFMRLG